jgi:hypothetical protein
MGFFGLTAAVRQWVGGWKKDRHGKAMARGRRRGAALRCEWLESREMMAQIAPDFAVFRPSDLTVRLDYAATGLTGADDAVITMQGVAATDSALTGDINGDTIHDLAFFRPSTGEWRIDYDRNGVIDQTTTYFGAFPLGDVTPVLGDVSGNGFAALGVYRRSTGQWQFNNGRTFTFGGQAGDVPLLGDINVDGRADLLIYNPTVVIADPTYGGAPFNRSGNWKLKYNSFDSTQSHTNAPDFVYSFGPINQPNDKPLIVYTPSPQLGIHTTDGNGTRWLIDTDYSNFAQPADGADTVYVSAAATAADVPLVGFFDTRKSIFVSPSGNDSASGAFGAPLRTINAAVSRAPNGQGQIIRLAAGTYADTVNSLFQRFDLTFQGAGPLASIIAPPTGDAMLLERSDNIWFNNVNLRAAAGRGLVAIGSDVNTLNINTAGSRDAGGLAVGAISGSAKRTNWLAIGSHFDSAAAGDGVTMQGGATGTFSFSTFNANQGTGNNGRGLTLFNDSAVTIDSCAFVSNQNGGVITAGTSQLTLTRSALANNVLGNGVLLRENSNALIQSNYFAHNGTTYGLPQGLNGVELLGDYVGLARILGNTFFDSTGFGVFISGSTQFAEIRGNYFNHSNAIVKRVCIGMNGALDQSGGPGGSIARAVIQGNLLDIPVGDTIQEGIFMLGAGVTATIGGAGGANVNVFRNFAANNAIDPSDMGGGFPNDFGCPNINGDAATVNVFVNTAAPFVRPC